ncbi:MAG: hypothetical protein LBE79_04770 [Tannerella sp.]|jgi:hypothetical protein|nr:hypothetical protein [Tannerella sp.]
MAYGYQAILELDGEKPIVLDNCSYIYERDINEKTCEVQSGVLGGSITLMYIDYPTGTILEWGMKPKLKNGSIKVRQTDSNVGTYVPAEAVKLSDAVCVEFELDYNRQGGSHFSTRLILSSNQSSIGESSAEVNKKWKLVR